MDMYDRQRLKLHRSSCNKVGWFMMLYVGIMYLCVEMEVIIEALLVFAQNPLGGMEEFQNALLSTTQAGWGYIAMMIGVVLMLILWKKPKYIFSTIWEKGRPLHFLDFAVLLILFVGVQGVSQLCLMAAEAVLNGFGYTILERLSLVSGGSDTLPMFIYSAVGAPIIEELMFRGVVMRQLRPAGKNFSIVASAVLFGLFHGNLIQIPFAILVGLILGYVATEYSLSWAILLHMLNNMILADTLSRVLPTMTANSVAAALFYGCLIIGALILILRRKEIKFYLKNAPKDPVAYRGLFSAAGIIVFLVYVLFSVAYTALVLITPLSS